jgi:hypothetical protein
MVVCLLFQIACLVGVSIFTPCRAFLLTPYENREICRTDWPGWGKQGARAPKKEPEGLAVARLKRTYSTKITRKMRQPLASSHIKPYHYTGFLLILQ